MGGLFVFCLGCRYVIIYFSILYLRYRSGMVTDEMIALPKTPFVAIGALDVLGVAAGMASVGTIYFALSHQCLYRTLHFLIVS